MKSFKKLIVGNAAVLAAFGFSSAQSEGNITYPSIPVESAWDAVISQDPVVAQGKKKKDDEEQAYGLFDFDSNSRSFSPWQSTETGTGGDDKSIRTRPTTPPPTTTAPPPQFQRQGDPPPNAQGIVVLPTPLDMSVANIRGGG